jgi:Copine
MVSNQNMLSRSRGLTYTILVIFTNGIPKDTSKTRVDLKEVNDAPLSVEVIGIGVVVDREE